MKLLRDSAFWSGPRSLSRSAVYLALVLLASFAVDRSEFLVDSPVFVDGHALLSLELAMTRAYCGQPSSFSSTVRIPYDVRDHLELRHVPLRSLIDQKAGTVSAYCHSVNVAVVNNENSLMLLEAAILRVAPGISVAQLGEILRLIGILASAVFVLLLMVLGASLALALATMLCALFVLGTMHNEIYSAYPLVFTLVLFATAFYGFALQYRWTRHTAGVVLFATVAGALSAFIANNRTSNLSTALVFFACFLSSELLPRGRAPSWPRRGVRAVLLTGCFALGFTLLQYGLITRFFPPETIHNAAHSIGHPLVLAVSVPDNDFSRREGITWLDEVGRQKALAVDPTASYLGPRYDHALLQYYKTLWSTHPREMLGVYRLKFSVTGTHMLTILQGGPGTSGRVIRLLLTPLSHVPNGIWLLGLYVAIAFCSAGLFVRNGAPQWFVLALLSLAAVLAHLEASVIYSLYFAPYHAYLAFWAIFSTLLAVQAVVNAGGLPIVTRLTHAFDAARQIQSREFSQKTLPNVESLAPSPSRGRRSIAATLFLMRDARPSWMGVGVLIVSLTVLICAVTPPPWQWDAGGMAADGQARSSLDMALMRATCGHAGPASSARSPVAFDLQVHPDDRALPLREVAARAAGSLDRYCHEGIVQTTQSEMSLMLVETLLLEINPRLSLVQLGRRLHTIRVVALVFVSVVLVEVGFSVAWVVLFFTGGLALLILLVGGTYSVYPFLPVLVVTLVACYSLWLRIALFRQPRLRLVAALLAGALSAFCVNLRSSYLPTCVAMFMVAAPCAEWFWQSSPSLRSVLRRTLFGAACYLMGYFCFQTVFIRPLVIPGQISFHPVAHPLVLSLAFPPNSLSQREGIQWDDMVGARIALSLNPQAAYLSPEYERTLLKYYLSLWRNHPAEMLGIYAAKLQISGSSIVEDLGRTEGPVGRSATVLLAPMRWFRNGVWLLCIFAGTAGLALWRVVRRRSTSAFPILMFSVAAVMLQLETAAIMPYFFLPYEGYLALSLLVLSLVAYQLGLNGVVAAVGRASRIERVRAAARTAWSFAQSPIAWFVRAVTLVRAPQPPMRAVLQSAVFVGLISLLVPAWFSIERTVTHDPQAFQLLDDAIGRALCRHSAAVPIAEEAATQGDLQITPIRTLALAKSGSLETFCDSASGARHRRSPLAWLEAAVFRARPNISAAGMAKALHFIRLTGVVGFVVLLMRMGYSVAGGLGVTLLGFWFLASLKESLFSVSPFGPIVFLYLVAFYSLAIWRRWATRTSGSVIVGSAAGAWSALVVRMNWGDAVTPAILFSLFVLLESVVRPGIRPRKLDRILMAACFAVAYAFFLRFIEAATPSHVINASLGTTLVFGLCLLCTASTGVWLLKSRSPPALIAAMSCVGACLAQAAAFVNPGGWPDSFTYLIFAAALSALLCGQGLADELRNLTARPMREHRA
jgi:hypothetical protein